MKPAVMRLRRAALCAFVVLAPQALVGCSGGADLPEASPVAHGPVVVIFEPDGSSIEVIGTGKLALGSGGCLEVNGPTAFPQGARWQDGRLVGFGSKTYALGDPISFDVAALGQQGVATGRATFPKECLPEGSKVTAVLPLPSR